MGKVEGSVTHRTFLGWQYQACNRQVCMGRLMKRKQLAEITPSRDR